MIKTALFKAKMPFPGILRLFLAPKSLVSGLNVLKYLTRMRLILKDEKTGKFYQ